MRRSSAINTGVAIKNLPPCGGCKRRAVGCHSACVDYASYKKRLAEAKAEIVGSNQHEDFIVDYKIENKKRLERKRKK